MSIIIAKKDEIGYRYITVETDKIRHFDWILNTIRNFYKSPQKVSTLIDLGNLEWIGPSPYKKTKGDDDIVNCEAKIRDKKLSPGKHGYSYVTDEQALLKNFDRCDDYYIMNSPYYRINCCFLFEDNKWYVLVGAHKEAIETVDKSILLKDNLMKGLEVYKYTPSSNYHRLENSNVKSWTHIQQKANENNRNYHVFRNNKLIKIIHPQVESISEQKIL